MPRRKHSAECVAAKRNRDGVDRTSWMGRDPEAEKFAALRLHEIAQLACPVCFQYKKNCVDLTKARCGFGKK